MEIKKFIEELQDECVLFDFSDSYINLYEYHSENCEDFFDEWSDFLISIKLNEVNKFEISKNKTKKSIFEHIEKRYIDIYEDIIDFLNTPIQLRKLDAINIDDFPMVGI